MHELQKNMQKQIEIPQRPFKEVSEIRSVHMSKKKNLRYCTVCQSQTLTHRQWREELMDQWGFTKVSRLKPGWEDGDLGSGAGEGWRPREVISPSQHRLVQAAVCGCFCLLAAQTEAATDNGRQVSAAPNQNSGLVGQKPAVTVRRGASLAVQSWWWSAVSDQDHTLQLWQVVFSHKAACFLLLLSSPSLASFSFCAPARCYAHCALHTRGICTWYKHILQAKEVCISVCSLQFSRTGFLLSLKLQHQCRGQDGCQWSDDNTGPMCSRLLEIRQQRFGASWRREVADGGGAKLMGSLP